MQVFYRPTTSTLLPGSLERISLSILVAGSMTKSMHRIHSVCHVIFKSDISTASTRKKHVKCQPSLPEGCFQWKLAGGQDQISCQKPAFGTRSSHQRAAASLPRVFHSRSKEGLHTDRRDPVDISIASVLKFGSIGRQCLRHS